MTKYTAAQQKEFNPDETLYFHFDIGVVSWNPDAKYACGSRWYQGQIFDRTPRFVLWGEEHYAITDLHTGNEIHTDFRKEIFSITDEELEELDETTYVKKSEAIEARNDKAAFDALWKALKENKEDLESTEKLLKACAVVGLPLLDHIIITKNGYYSFCENDEMKTDNISNAKVAEN